MMDAPTLSAIAASVAAAVAASVAGIQFYIGRTQAQAALTSAKAALMNAQNTGRHTVADFRQKWIDKVIDALSEHHSIVMTRRAGGKISIDDEKRLAGTRARLEILLNPAESDTVELLKRIDDVAASDSMADRAAKEDQMLTVARRLLKREWVRIKEELR